MTPTPTPHPAARPGGHFRRTLETDFVPGCAECIRGAIDVAEEGLDDRRNTRITLKASVTHNHTTQEDLAFGIARGPAPRPGNRADPGDTSPPEPARSATTDAPGPPPALFAFAPEPAQEGRTAHCYTEQP